MDRRERFISKASKIHNNKYDYSKTEYKNNRTKINILCPIHGEFKQMPNAHVKGRGCLKCGKIKSANSIKKKWKMENNNIVMPRDGSKKNNIHKLATEEFISRANVVHGHKYTYDRAVYCGVREKITIICFKHGEFRQIPGCHLGGNGCPECAGTYSQNNINLFVNSLGFDTLYDDRIQIAPYELDVFVPQKKVAIEFNGLYWHSYNNTKDEDKNRHVMKSDKCNEKGIELIQVFENEWREKRKIVKSIIKLKLGVASEIDAAECVIAKIDNKLHKQFMDQNHIYGDKECSVAYGLFCGKKMVFVMSFSKPNGKWEVARSTNKLGISAIGGEEKLFNEFINDYDPHRVFVYDNRGYSDGNIYSRLGFKMDEVIEPSYCYVKNQKIYHYGQLKNKLIIDPSLTEVENMFRGGYRRLWDTGCYRFIWER